MSYQGASPERGAVAAFLVVASVAGALLISEFLPSGSPPTPPQAVVSPLARPAAWALAPEGPAWGVRPERRTPFQVAVLNLGDIPRLPPAAIVSAGDSVVSVDRSACALPVRPGRGCLLTLEVSPVEDGPIPVRISLPGTETSTEIRAVAEGFSGKVQIRGEPVFVLSMEADPTSGMEMDFSISNTGFHPVRAPLSIQGAGFSLAGTENCPAVLESGNGCAFRVSFQPIALGASPGRLRAGAAEVALLGTVPDWHARTAVALRAVEDGWEAEVRNTGPLAFVGPTATGVDGASVVIDGCRARPLAPEAVCVVRLSGEGGVRFGGPIEKTFPAPF